MVRWGISWAVALAIVALTFLTLDWRAPAVYYPLALVVGIVALGIPVERQARFRESRNPRLEAATWVIAFMICAQFVISAVTPTLASANDLNIVTSEDMRRRTEYFQTWHLPPLAKAFLRGALTFGLLGGIASAFLTPMTGAWLWKLVRGILFGIVVAAAFAIGLLVIAIGTPTLGQILSESRQPQVELIGLLAGVIASGFGGGLAMGFITIAGERLIPSVSKD